MHSRSEVYSARGLVCSNSPLAASAGARVLADGGNAFDAALTVAAVEAVVQPPMCGLGGDVFALGYQASNGRVFGLNGSGGAPSGATIEFYRERGFKQMPLNGPLSIAVPGAVHAWETFHAHFCTRPFGQLLEPAIAYAAEGFPVPPRMAGHFAASARNLAKFPASAEAYLRGEEPYRAGDRLVQRDLARSLARVADGGAEEFYRGDLSRALLKGLDDAGALFTASDFAKHQSELYEPPSVTYRGHTIYEPKPPSQGFMLLEMLNILEGFDLAGLAHNSADAIHLMIEAKKIAFADRNRYAGDPAFVSWPLDTLLSKAYAEGARAAIDPLRASTQTLPLPVADGDTSYFCVADAAGNAVSFIHSLSKAFGSDFVAPGTGILFNNRAGRGFVLQPNHPNALAPGKRTMHTLSCFLATRDGKASLVGGTPGGDLQTQAGVQLITAVLDHRLGLQPAVDAPRWLSVPGTDPAGLDRPMSLDVEAALPSDVRHALEAKGHPVRVADVGGVAQMIAFDAARGVMTGASDSRGDGMAVAI
ncbi:MAG: gamma-glutamyltransferase [Chloroflexi bacterium]|nr:gamma-glutamyltransferase [Chloroflexota bacterium]